jgi:arylsulfatase A-like enzyme
MAKKTNLIFIGIDSLRADHMSLYGYDRLTTPHIDKFAKGGAVYDWTFSPHIPTTSGYGAMLTGMDCFTTGLVALRHKGDSHPGVKTLAEILRQDGYTSTCVGFPGNPASRGFDKYLDYEGWGSWEKGRSHKAESLNAVMLPELRRLARDGQPFFLFMRHMDPHSPYLPPQPFDRVFYDKDEFDPANKSLEPLYDFKPFCDYFRTWFPPGVTDKDYIIAQYDGAIAYMDACIANIFATVETLGLTDDTLIVIDSDHGETLFDHDCYFDHHGLYEPTLRVPLIFRLPGRVPANKRVSTYNTMMNITPTILDLMNVPTDIKFDGVSLVPEMQGAWRRSNTELYITECTWMRKHGWRTPQWKYIHALEPDFHFKPEFELYNLIEDPAEMVNLADREKGLVEMFEKRMQAWIAKRERESGHKNPIHENLQWHGTVDVPGAFGSSQEAYNRLHIGDPEAAKRLQAMAAKRKS